MELLNIERDLQAFSGVSVLSGVELHVNVGEIHALLGENGAGKSTLMNILSGSYTADAGTVTFDGADITGSSIKQIEDAGIAFVHQELNLFNDLLAYENIFLGPRRPPRGVRSKSATWQIRLPSSLSAWAWTSTHMHWWMI